MIKGFVKTRPNPRLSKPKKNERKDAIHSK
jgi:hypothetical protein